MHNPAGNSNPAAQNIKNPVPEFISINRESINEHQNDFGGHQPSKAAHKGRGRGGGSVVYGAPKGTPTGSGSRTPTGSGPRGSLVTPRGQTGSDHVRNIKRKREAISGDRIEVTNSYEHFNGASNNEAVQTTTNGVESVQEMPWHPAGLHQYTKGIIG